MDMDDLKDDLKDGFKFCVKVLIVCFIASQIISYKVLGPYSLLCWNEVTSIMFWGLILCAFVSAIFVLIPWGCFIVLGWLLDKFVKDDGDDDDKKI